MTQRDHIDAPKSPQAEDAQAARKKKIALLVVMLSTGFTILMSLVTVLLLTR